MSKKSILFFAAGAVAGWTAAQRLTGEAEPWQAASSGPIDKDTTPTDLWESRPESPVTRPVTAGGDPFRGAFAGALAEIEAHAEQQAEPDPQVA